MCVCSKSGIFLTSSLLSKMKRATREHVGKTIMHVKDIGRGFSVTEQQQHAGGAKCYLGCHPASIWCETVMHREREGSSKIC